MVIAVVAVRMMQVPVDEVVDVFAVGHRLVTAARAVHMVLVVASTLMLRGATFRIGRGDLDHVLIDVTIVHVVQMTVMQVVDVIAVAHRRVAAAGTVHMAMIGVLGMVAGWHQLARFCLSPSMPGFSQLSKANRQRILFHGKKGQRSCFSFTMSWL